MVIKKLITHLVVALSVGQALTLQANPILRDKIQELETRISILETKVGISSEAQITRKSTCPPTCKCGANCKCNPCRCGTRK